MPDENLVKYIKDGLAQGRTEDILRPILASAGWAQKDVDDGFNFIKGVSPSSQPVATPSVPTNQPSSLPPIQAKTHFFSWRGRIGRLRYLITSIILGIIFWIANIIIAIFAFPASIASIALLGGFGFLAMPLLWLIVLVIEVLLSSFVTVKRFHDINKDGWYFLALIVPFFDIYLWLSLFLECGTDGANNYGNDPLPPGANHNGFIARLGKSVAFKLIVTLLLSGLIIYGFVLNALHPQQPSQQQVNQEIDQMMTNQLNGYPSSTPSVTSSSQPTTPANGWNSKEVYNASNPAVCYTIQYPSELVPHNLAAPGVIWFEDPSAPGDNPEVASDGVRIDIYPNTTIAAQSGVNGFLYSYYSHSLITGVTSTEFTTDGGLQAEEFLINNGGWMFYVAMPGVGSTTILEVDDPVFITGQNIYNINNAKEMVKSINPTCGH
jgi:uncharacterized membrane protein YhaH (DUF805 family)